MILPNRTLVLQLSLLASLSLGAQQPADADDIYKITRKDGTVYYSNVPPGESEQARVIDAIPEPSDADRQAAEQRLREIRANSEERRARRAGSTEAQTTEAQPVEDAGEAGQTPQTPSNPLPAIAPLF